MVIMLALCLMLLSSYYAQNYGGIIASSLCNLCCNPACIRVVTMHEYCAQTELSINRLMKIAAVVVAIVVC